MKNKNLIVTGEDNFGFVRGEHELKLHHKVWDIRKTPCVDYQGSIESLSQNEIYYFGLYLLIPTNIFNIITGQIKTTIESTARVWTLSCRSNWYYLTPKTYPLYDINNKYMGYITNDKPYYTNLYKANGNKYLVLFIEHKKMIYLLILYFSILMIILNY